MSGKKILVIGKGSKVDPGFDKVEINGIPYREHMSNLGITVLEKDLIESCHGCPDLMSEYSDVLQERVEAGDRVVEILQGGLLFALPSIQATQTTFPIISQPLDLVSFQAFMVPTGHAAIASVGREKITAEGHYR